MTGDAPDMSYIPSKMLCVGLSLQALKDQETYHRQQMKEIRKASKDLRRQRRGPGGTRHRAAPLPRTGGSNLET